MQIFKSITQFDIDIKISFKYSSNMQASRGDGTDGKLMKQREKLGKLKEIHKSKVINTGN